MQKGTRKALCEKLHSKLRDIRLGPSLPAEEVSETDLPKGQKIGPVVSKSQYDKIWVRRLMYLNKFIILITLNYMNIKGFINEAKAQGLNITAGGEYPEGLPAGYFIPPTVIEDPPVTSRVWVEEIFGPVLCIRVSNRV